MANIPLWLECFEGWNLASNSKQSLMDPRNPYLVQLTSSVSDHDLGFLGKSKELHTMPNLAWAKQQVSKSSLVWILPLLMNDYHKWVIIFTWHTKVWNKLFSLHLAWQPRAAENPWMTATAEPKTSLTGHTDTSNAKSSLSYTLIVTEKSNFCFTRKFPSVCGGGGGGRSKNNIRRLLHKWHVYNSRL